MIVKLIPIYNITAHFNQIKNEPKIRIQKLKPTISNFIPVESEDLDEV